ncbi:MAG TPA: hypothetical protein VLM76_15155 [Patescibacteria group bacterium]|nr:hypothetical protein [Patescibacteria group bacterium]
MTTLLSTPEEAALCRAAFAAMPDAAHAAHVHHGAEPFERLYEPVENRIACILAHKPLHEQAIRLHCLRPLTAEQWPAWEAADQAAWDAYDAAFVDRLIAGDVQQRGADPLPAWDAYNAAQAATAPARVALHVARRAAHDVICPVMDCPWDGWTIFGEGADR